MRIFLALWLAAAAYAQTTVHLRTTQSADSFWLDFNVAGASSNTTPLVLTSAVDTTVQTGDPIGLYNVLFNTGSGCGSGRVVNGTYKVKAKISARVFSVANLDGSDFPSPGTWCLGGIDGSIVGGGPQYGGKVVAYTLASGMKGVFDGDTGPFTRSIAMGVWNGLTSLVVAGNVATVTHSAGAGYVGTGDKVGIWNSSSSALNNGNAPYTVTVDSPTQFHFPTSGVADGTYSGTNNTCGPSGAADCLRISTRAWVGSVWWDGLKRTTDLNATGRSKYDGGTWNTHPQNADGGGAYTDSGDWSALALRLFVDQANTTIRDSTIYWATHWERANGVNFVADETLSSGGNSFWADQSGWLFRDIAILYAIARPYLTAQQQQDARDKVLNNVDNGAVCNKVFTHTKPGATATYNAGTGHITGVGTLWLTDADTSLRLAAGDAVWMDSGPSASEWYVSAVNSDTDVTVITSHSGSVATPFAPGIVHAWRTADCGGWWLKTYWGGDLGHQIISPPTYNTNMNPFGDVHYPLRGTNNGFTMMNGVLSAALAMADDDPRAVTLLEEYQAYWWDYYTPENLGIVTGFNKAGAYYTYGRPGVDGPQAATWLRNSIVGYPDEDLAGPWIKGTLYLKMYSPLPDMLGGRVWPAPWGTEVGDNSISAGVPQSLAAYLTDATMRWDPTSTEAGYWKSWITGKGWWSGLFFSPDWGTTEFLTNSDQHVPAADYTTLPTQYRWQKTGQAKCASYGLNCPATRRFDSFISRTGWTNTNDTLVLARLGTHVGSLDHDMPQGGSLTIYKGGYLLGSSSQPPGRGAVSSDTALTTWRDSLLQFGGDQNMQRGDSIGLGHEAVATIERWAGADEFGDAQSRYAYAMAELKGMYTVPIARAQRHIVHFKKPGLEEVVVQYDDIDVSGTPTSVMGQIHYPQSGEAAITNLTYAEGDTTCPGVGGCAALNSNRWIHTQEAGGAQSNSLNTRIFAPGTIAVSWDGSSYPNNQGHDYRVRIDAGAAPGATVSAADWLVVHRVVDGNLSDTALTAAALSPSSGWYGVQTTNAVALFARGGVCGTVVNFTSTHAGTAQYLLANLCAGSYSLIKDGSTVSTITVTDGNNSAYWEGTAGTYTFSGGPVLTASPGSLPLSCYTGASSAPASLAISASGSTISGASFSVDQSWLHVSPSTLSGAGSVSVTADCSAMVSPGTATGNITINASGSPALTNSPVTDPVTLTITASVLSVSPGSVARNCTVGGTHPSASLAVGSTGVALTAWTAASDQAWLTLSPLSGSVAGSTGAALNCDLLSAGTYTAHATVSSSTSGITNSPQQSTITMQVYSAPSITTTVLPSGFAGFAYSGQIQATGGQTPYAWSVISGALPGGMTLDSATGVVSGTAMTSALSSFTVRLLDAGGAAATQPIALAILAPPAGGTVGNPATAGSPIKQQ